MKQYFKLLLLLTCLVPALFAAAEPVSPEQARESARSFFAQHASRRARAQGVQGVQQLALAYEARTSATAEPDFYVFNLDSNAGFVIVAADDAAPAVLGYTESGTFDYNSIPDNLRWWLGEYQREIQYLKSHPQSAPRRAANLPTSVEPLVRTMWNQDAPYNNMCPTYSYTYWGETYSGTCATGCVATAIAQIMNYHRWPVRGTGSKSYYTYVNNSYTQLSCNFSQSIYDWDNMLYAYGSNATTAQNNAVALLMRDVGYGCEMEYGESSGAYTTDAVDALKTYFGYDADLKMFSRSDFGIASWEQMLRDELDARRPMYYAGASTEGGHAFVFDGYNSDGYFHVNWGWGGSSNGYFLVSALNPDDQGIGSFDGGYNTGQEVIIGIKPDDGVTGGSTLVAQYNSFSLSSSTSVNLGSSTTLRTTQTKLLGNKRWNTLHFGVRLMNADETQVVAESPRLTQSSLTLNSSATTLSVPYTFPTSLVPGTYHLYFTYTTDNDPTRVCVSTGTSSHLVVTVANNKATLSQPSKNLQLVELTPSATQLYTGGTFNVSATVKNLGSDYFDNFTFRLMKGSSITKSDNIKVGISTGDQVTFSTLMNVPSSTGSYTLGVYDSSGTLVGQTQNITVSTGASASSLSISTHLTPKASVMPSDDVQATAKIKNSGSNPWMGVINMLITDGDYILAEVKSNVVNIPAGGTATLSYKCEFGGEVGTDYLMCLRDPRYTNQYQVWGNTYTFRVSGLEPTIVKTVPVMNPVDETTITDNSFRADWTAVDNVTSYNLQVDKTSGNVTSLIRETFAKCTAYNSTNVASTLDNYTDVAGWTGAYCYRDSAGLRLGNSSQQGNLKTPAFTGEGTGGKVIVSFEAQPANNASDYVLKVYRVGDSNQQSINLDPSNKAYTLTIDVEEVANQKIIFQPSTKGKPVTIRNVEIKAANNGAAQLIEGITDNFYTVTGLEPGQSYKYKVQANYTDGTTSAWSNIETVTLTGSAAILGDINRDGSVNVADVNLMISIVLGTDSLADYPEADLNGDGTAGIADLNLLINIVLSE